MEDDWDLYAVVRSCTTPANTTTTTTTTTTISSSSSATTFSNFQPRTDDENNKNNNFLLCFQDPVVEPRILLNRNSTTSTDFEELHQLCKPFFIQQSEQITTISSSPQRLLLPISPISVLGRIQNLPPPPSPSPQQQQLTNTKLIQPKRPLTCSLHAQSPRNKRRKNQLKKVCQVAADGLSSDMWSWRKYGQKPIKGSPYPRGYYKCSTSKGCLARKQVERNRSDPNTFMVTYTAEHNHPMPTHRNSLAGISRSKTAKPTSSSPVSSPAINSPAPENQESSRDEREDIFEDEDDEFGVSDVGLDKMEPDDDFFDGLDELEIPATGDSLSEKFPGTLQFPWLANNATTTAAGGG